MTCPACGSELSRPGARCPRCEAALISGGKPARYPNAEAGTDDLAATMLSQTPAAPPPVGRPSGTPDADQLTVAVPPPTVLSGATTPLASAPTDTDPTAGTETTQAVPRARKSDGDTGPLEPGQTFGPRYHIIRVLGVGGMGAVYQAWDAELGEAVAIKVIRPEVMADREAAWELEKRFKRELLLARQVTHRNVVRIHDLGDIDGIKYITMSYVDGTDLSTLIRQEGALHVQRALAITRSVAAGLLAAHAAGVVHRDLKPGNIMVRADGEALIMDFGIARSTGASSNTSGVVLKELPAELRSHATNYTEATMAGSVVGTVPYMPPEQVRGEDVDERADLYALGLILYDMLTGRARFERAENPRAELQQRMTQAPPPVRTLVPSVPEPLSKLISRCIEPDRDSRFATTAEFVAALDLLDDRGVLLPRIRRLTPRLVAAAAALVVLLLAGTFIFTRQALAPPPERAPMSVVIADVENGTGDSGFDRALEPIIKLALEEAGFITAQDRSQIRRNLGVQPPEVMGADAARQLAVQQGLGVVVAGSLQQQGRGYALSMSAVESVSGNEIARVRATVASRDDVLGLAARLAGEVREALGGEPSDSAQRFAMEALSATSLDVVRRYALAIEAASDGRFDDARRDFSDAVGLDPDFGLAYAGMGMMLRNLGQQQEAETNAQEALRHLDGMTERERYRTRGIFYTVTSDYAGCVQEYGELIARYASDAAARSNRALCQTYLRDMRGAVEEMRRVVEILPRRALYRVNLGLYAAYSTDFAAAEQEARAAVDLGSPLGLLPLAFAQLGQGQLREAAASFEKLGAAGGVGASFAASGLGDLAMLEGRFGDADRIFRDGAAADLAAGSADRAAAKFAALARVRLAAGQSAAAVEAARTALGHSQGSRIRFLAARVLAAAGEAGETAPLVEQLDGEVTAEPRAYAKIVEAEGLLASDDARRAIVRLNEANELLDTWIGRFLLGRAYLQAGDYIRADSEFDNTLARRGEALALFLDEEPTYSLLPEVYYYQGQVREALQSARFADSYRTYLQLRGAAGEDPRLADIRTRVDAAAR